MKDTFALYLKVLLLSLCVYLIVGLIALKLLLQQMFCLTIFKHLDHTFKLYNKSPYVFGGVWQCDLYHCNQGLQSIYHYLNYGWDLHETCVYVDNFKIYFDHYHLMVLLVAQYPFKDVPSVVCNGCVS